MTDDEVYSTTSDGRRFCKHCGAWALQKLDTGDVANTLRIVAEQNGDAQLALQAADEIERLRALVAELDGSNQDGLKAAVLAEHEACIKLCHEMIKFGLQNRGYTYWLEQYLEELEKSTLMDEKKTAP